MSHQQHQQQHQAPSNNKPTFRHLLKNVFKSQAETHHLYTILSDFVNEEEQGVSGTRDGDRFSEFVYLERYGFPESGKEQQQQQQEMQSLVNGTQNERANHGNVSQQQQQLPINTQTTPKQHKPTQKQTTTIHLWKNVFSLHGGMHKPLNFQKYKKRLKSLIRYHGVPQMYRPKVWLESSGAHWKIEQNRGYYQKMIQIHSTHQNVAERQIELDLARTFPTHPYFNSDQSEGRKKLRRILTAFSWRNPLVAYCQSLNFIVAILLLHFEEDDAFWMLVVILEEILPADFYNPQLKGVRTDGKVLDSLIEFYLPRIHRKFVELDMDTSSFVTRWFMTLYVDVFPIETVMRIWDVMFNEGSKIMFRIALAFLKLHENALLKCQHMGEVLNYFNEATQNMHDADRLMKTCFSFYTLRNKSIDRKRATCANLVEQETQEMEARRQEAAQRFAERREELRREREAAAEEEEDSKQPDSSEEKESSQTGPQDVGPQNDDTNNDSSPPPPPPKVVLVGEEDDDDDDDEDEDEMDVHIQRMSSAIQGEQLKALAQQLAHADSQKQTEQKSATTRRNRSTSGATARSTASRVAAAAHYSPQKFSSASAINARKMKQNDSNSGGMRLYQQLIQSRENDGVDYQELQILMQQHEKFVSDYYE